MVTVNYRGSTGGNDFIISSEGLTLIKPSHKAHYSAAFFGTNSTISLVSLLDAAVFVRDQAGVGGGGVVSLWEAGDCGSSVGK